MATLTLLLAAMLSIGSAIVYAIVGWRLSRREVGPEAKRAHDLFVVWWYALGGATLLGAANQFAAGFGYTDLPLYVSFTHMSLLLICIGLWGLLYYLLFLFTGRAGVLTPLTLFYIGYYVLLVYAIVNANPIGLKVGRWNVTAVYERPFEGPFTTALIALLVFPQVFGAAAYFTLAFKLRDRTQRFRVTVVSLSIIAWFLSSFLASVAGLGESDAWQLASRGIGLGAALLILTAYHPPGWMRRRLHIAAVGGEPPPTPPTPKRDMGPKRPSGLPSWARQPMRTARRATQWVVGRAAA
jgi:hypothetical protein